jgi:hypothetical protein
MKKYQAQVRISGIWVITAIFANSAQHAQLILRQLFGAANAPHMPLQVP